MCTWNEHIVCVRSLEHAYTMSRLCMYVWRGAAGMKHLRLLPTEGLSPIEHLIDEHAQCIDVAAGAGHLALQNFRSHPKGVAPLPQPVLIYLHSHSKPLLTQWISSTSTGN